MRNVLVTMGCLLALALPRAAEAQLTMAANRVANEPAATLLLPYFEVELPKKIGGKSSGINTIFSINNASATAVLAHVTIWSDLAVPITNFNVYLTGYDTQTVDMFQVLNGHLPRTASAGQDPGDLISNRGEESQDINFASCSGQLPYPDPLPTETISFLRETLTGNPAQLTGGLCAGRKLPDKKPTARGYVTVDVVNHCTLRFPSEPGYFIAGGLGDATNQNVLWGDYFYINKSKKIGRGDALIHIQASATDPETSVPGEYTFYDRYVASTAADGRQPLATSFAGRFVNVPKHPVFPTGTSIIAWRDTKRSQPFFNCATTPTPFPLSQEGIVVFDEQENPEIPQRAPIPPFFDTEIIPFPAAAQITKVGGPDFPVTSPSGWLYLNLNTATVNPVPAEDPAAAQATVSIVLESKGKYSASYRAITLDSATDALHYTPGQF